MCAVSILTYEPFLTVVVLLVLRICRIYSRDNIPTRVIFERTNEMLTTMTKFILLQRVKHERNESLAKFLS